MQAVTSAYYRTRFPWSDYQSLLSIPSSPTSPALPTRNRELSFRKGWRYISAEDASYGDDSVRKLVCTRHPQRLDIGAFYTLPIRLRPLGFQEFQPEWVELRFDIDITDYDSIRLCTGKKLCPECIPLLVCGARILDYLLETIYDFRDRLWCFSGGRGLHCWVLDPEAAFMTAAQRVELSDYLRAATLGHVRPESIATLPHQEALHEAFISFAKLTLLDCVCLGRYNMRQGGLGNRVKEFISKLPPDLSAQCTRQWLNKRADPRPEEDWRDLRISLGPSMTQALAFSIVFPKIDHAVTRSINHMLRAPFSVREDNYRIVQPLDLSTLDRFDFENSLNAQSLDLVQLERSVELFRAALRGRSPESQYLVCHKCLVSVSDLNDLPADSVFEGSGQLAEHWISVHRLREVSFDISRCTVAAVVARLFTRNSPDRKGCKQSILAKTRYYEALLSKLSASRS
jgi:DNA primase small subunit